MREKFQKLMQYKQLTSSRLAELLGVQASGISHILNKEGRKPSYELIQKILLRFPEINPDWLILDSPNMLRDNFNSPTISESDNNTKTITSGEKSLFSSGGNDDASSKSFFTVTDANAATDFIQNPHSHTQKSIDKNYGGNSNFQQHNTSENGLQFRGLAANDKSVKRVIVLFEDHTFESYEVTK